jgi:hypothetical protein
MSQPRTPPDVEDGEAAMGSARWQIDRHVNLSMVGAIALQTAIAIWWAATFSASITGRVEVLERQAVTTAPLSERLVKIETKFDGMTETLTEIKNLIRQVPTRSEPRAP